MGIIGDNVGKAIGIALSILKLLTFLILDIYCFSRTIIVQRSFHDDFQELTNLTSVSVMKCDRFAAPLNVFTPSNLDEYRQQVGLEQLNSSTEYSTSDFLSSCTKISSTEQYFGLVYMAESGDETDASQIYNVRRKMLSLLIALWTLVFVVSVIVQCGSVILKWKMEETLNGSQFAQLGKAASFVPSMLISYIKLYLDTICSVYLVALCNLMAVEVGEDYFVTIFVPGLGFGVYFVLTLAISCCNCGAKIAASSGEREIAAPAGCLTCCTQIATFCIVQLPMLGYFIYCIQYYFSLENTIFQASEFATSDLAAEVADMASLGKFASEIGLSKLIIEVVLAPILACM